MVLPKGVLAYKVLNNANISPEKKQLIRATVLTLTYENMTKQLKAIIRATVLTLTYENMTKQLKAIIRATVLTLTYENMTKQLKAIHDSSGNSVNSNDNFDNKCEPVYYANKSLDYSHQAPKDGYRGSRGSNSRNRDSRFLNQFKKQSCSNSENYDKWG